VDLAHLANEVCRESSECEPVGDIAWLEAAKRE
jgi:hypothetical protein